VVALHFQKRLALFINEKHNSECGHMELVYSPANDNGERSEIFFMNGSCKKYIVKYGKEALHHNLSEDTEVIDVFDFENTPAIILKNIKNIH